jgi:hypothetical protein
VRLQGSFCLDKGTARTAVPLNIAVSNIVLDDETSSLPDIYYISRERLELEIDSVNFMVHPIGWVRRRIVQDGERSNSSPRSMVPSHLPARFMREEGHLATLLER